MKRFALLALAAAICLAPASARGQVTYPLVRVFVTVDAIEMDANLTITGILQGEAQPSTLAFAWTYSSTYSFREECQRAALLVMTKPGQYLFQVRQNYAGSLPICKLTRVNP
jgi:hypothetical protein